MLVFIMIVVWGMSLYMANTAGHKANNRAWEIATESTLMTELERRFGDNKEDENYNK